MEYQEYIELGFERIDINDGVVFKETGYYGYILVKKITDKITVEVDWEKLDEPRFLIHKPIEGQVHRIVITPEIVKYLLKN
jgi:hypothetical protein